MKNYRFIIGTLALAFSLSACQNKTSKTEATDSLTGSGSNMTTVDKAASADGMKGAMDKMMNEMHQMTMTGNTDYDFAMMMKSHHQGAVDMAQAELDSGQDDTLKQMAQKIKDGQTAEINELQSFIDSHKNPAKNYDPANKDTGFGKELKENMDMMMNAPKTEQHASVDKGFVHMMVPHHESAIDMAEGFIKYGKDQGLISLAKKIIAEQQKEIDQFKKWDQSHK